jgi:hypothetical protein
MASSPAMPMLPAFAVVGGAGFALNASIILSGVTSGRYNISARAVDAVGHVDGVGATVSFTVDLDPPTSTLVHTLETFVNRSRVDIDVTASDALSAVVRYVRVDGGAWDIVTAATVWSAGVWTLLATRSCRRTLLWTSRSTRWRRWSLR